MAALDGAHDADTVRFLLASDTHLGYMERDPVRGHDSLDTFEEILQLARAHGVDFVLLGGDLFHENKPSRPTLFRTMSLLRQYTMGDEPMSLELLSDPYDDVRKGQTFPMVNCEDMALNVCMPVFSIHGNHDDPQGMGDDGTLSALDVLAAAGLLNYFGRLSLPSSSSRKRRAPTSPDELIGVKPVLLQKGQTRIALYGMGYIKDERMSHELREKHICMYRPAEATDSWFNLLVLHQNRSPHTPKACVPESALDDSLHLVVWGHEHEQRIVPESVAEKSYKISQPGSTIATSLSPGETTTKSVALVEVTGQSYHLQPIPLRTVRPFLYKTLSLPAEAASAMIDPSDRVAVTKLLRNKIEDMLEEAERQWHASARAVERPLPLVRLRVSYDTQIPLGNLARFGQSFVGRVANPKDVLQLHLLRDRRRSAPGTRSSIVPLDSRMAPAEKLERMDLASLVMEHVRLQQFDLLHPQGLQTSMLGFVEKDERESIADFLDKTVARVEQQLSSQHMQESQLQTALERISAQLGTASTTELPVRPAELPSSQDSMEPDPAVRSSLNEQAPCTHVRPERRTLRPRLDDVSWPDAVEAEPAPPTDTVPVHSTPASRGAAERGASRRTRRRLPDGF